MVVSQQTDRFAMIRMAVTSMASSLLLVIISTPTSSYYFAFFFAVMAFVFTIGSLIKIPWLSDRLDGLSSGLTYAFLLISVVSVIRQLV